VAGVEQERLLKVPGSFGEIASPGKDFAQADMGRDRSGIVAEHLPKNLFGLGKPPEIAQGQP
jgi:hypothetical protein